MASLSQNASLSEEWEDVPSQRLLVEDVVPTADISPEWAYVDVAKESKIQATPWSRFDNTSLQGFILPKQRQVLRPRAGVQAKQPEPIPAQVPNVTSESFILEASKAQRQEQFGRSKLPNGRVARFNHLDAEAHHGTLTALETVTIQPSSKASYTLQPGLNYSLDKSKRWAHLQQLRRSSGLKTSDSRLRSTRRVVVSLSKTQSVPAPATAPVVSPQFRLVKTRKGTVVKPIRTPGKKGVKRMSSDLECVSTTVMEVEPPVSKGRYPLKSGKPYPFQRKRVGRANKRHNAIKNSL